jgi:hypothetical protein
LAALGIAQVNLSLLSFARAFFLRWRVNSSKTFSYSSVKIEVAYDWELKVLTVDEMDWQEYLEA